MKHLRKYENFADELLNDIGDENKEMQRPDLKGKPYDYPDVPNLPVVYAVEFVPAGTFKSMYNAESYLRDMGYKLGSSQGSAPVGFSDKYDYISKWRNMTPSEHKELDGVYIPVGDVREGGTLVLFFNEPNL